MKKTWSLSGLRARAGRLFGRSGRLEDERPGRRRAPAAPALTLEASDAAAARFGRISLDEIRESMGDRWPVLEPRVRAAAEAVIARNLTRGDVFEMQDDGSYAVLFARLDETQAEFKCRVIAREVRERLLGSGGGPAVDLLQAVPTESAGPRPPVDDIEFVLRETDPRTPPRAESQGGGPSRSSPAQLPARREHRISPQVTHAAAREPACEGRGPSDSGTPDSRPRRPGPAWREQVIAAEPAPSSRGDASRAGPGTSPGAPSTRPARGPAWREQMVDVGPTPSPAAAGPAGAGAPRSARPEAWAGEAPGWREQVVAPSPPRGGGLVPAEPIAQDEAGSPAAAGHRGPDAERTEPSAARTEVAGPRRGPRSNSLVAADPAPPSPSTPRDPGWREMERGRRIEPVVAASSRPAAGVPPEPAWSYTPVWDFRKMSLVRFRLTAAGLGAGPANDSRLDDEAVFARELEGMARALRELVVLSEEGRRLLLICVLSQDSLGSLARREQFLALLAGTPAAARRLLSLELFNQQFEPNLALIQFTEALESLGVPAAAGVSLESKAPIRPGGMPLAAAAAELGEGTGDAEAMSLLNTFSRRSAQVRLDAAVHRLDSRSVVIAAVAAGVRFLSGAAVHPPLPGLGDGLRFEPVDLYRDLLVGSPR